MEQLLEQECRTGEVSWYRHIIDNHIRGVDLALGIGKEAHKNTLGPVEWEYYEKVLSEARKALTTFHKEETIPCAARDHVYRTQKVRGLNNNTPFLIGVNSPEGHKVFPYKVPDWNQFVSKGLHSKTKPFLFVRPAPTRPRHGFVDSRIVSSWKEFYELWLATRAEDSDGEMIWMKKYDARFSAVANNAGVTWGMGNDGATNGDKSSVSIPALAASAKWNHYATGGSSGTLGIKHVAFLELVQNKTDHSARNISILVQTRDGPEVPTSKNFIPRDTKLEKVIRVGTVHSHDLLEWERKLKEAAKKYDPSKVAVYLPHSSLASHWAVHGVELGMNVVTDHEPNVGDELQASSNAVAPLTKKELKLLAEYINWWEEKDYLEHTTDYHYLSQAIITAFATIHAQSTWDGSKPLLNLRANSLVSLARFLTAAVAGEVRHCYSHGPCASYRGDEVHKSHLDGCCGIKVLNGFKQNKPERQQVYSELLRPGFAENRVRINQAALDDYNTPGWNGAFGGKKWAVIAEASLNLATGLEKFKNKPTREAWTDVILAANAAIHAVHNGGSSALGKWLSQSSLNAIAEAPAVGFVNPYAGAVVLGQPLYGE